MYDRMLPGMAEATRLTRAGQLIEATALIQRTLQNTPAPESAVDTSNRPSDEPIDGTFQVIDSASQPTEGSPQASAERTGSSLIGSLNLPNHADAVQMSEHVSIEVTDIPPSPQSSRLTETPTSIPPTLGSERVEPMSPIRDLPAHLRSAIRLPRRGRSEQAPHSMPDRARGEVGAGGQFVTGSYTNQAGTRTYKLYIPSGYHGQALPLVVMLHGCTQNPDDFAVGTRMNVLAEREQFLVVYPAQASSANQSRCWNWFKTSDQHRDQGEPSIIAGITRQLCSTYNVDRQRVYVAGLSAGGAMAMIMGVTYPDLYAAVGVHSGLAYGAAHDLPSAFAAMQNGQAIPTNQWSNRFQDAAPCPRVVPTIVFHGDRDTTVHQRNGEQVLAQWATINAGGTDSAAGTKLHVTMTKGRVSNGHSYTRSIYHDANRRALMEQWLIHGAGHAWSGGSPTGSFTDPKGPDATQEMIRFFLEHPQSAPSIG
jgi:poly(hydroxyalkanoate) depolymerase family esterase